MSAFPMRREQGNAMGVLSQVDPFREREGRAA
jgi:hypothetical protein